ncbi:hypothetical protein CYMTET_49424, partial [Cymbomonas tetramitiformis]
MQLGEELRDPPVDGVSSLVFAPDNDSILVTSWDKTIRIYDVASNTLQRKFTEGAPVLDGCYQDPLTILAGGLEKIIKRFDLNNGSSEDIGRHDAPVRCVQHCKDTGLIISGSWDATVRCWDPRTSPMAPICSLPQGAKVFSMTQSGHRLVVATAHRNINIYDKRMLRLAPDPEQSRESSLKYQT